MRRTMGIDLGTTNSAGVVFIDGKMSIVPSKEGRTPYGKMFPSVVAFKPDGEALVGDKARKYAYQHPERTIRWAKRHMGTDYVYEVDGVSYTPQAISAIILKEIKRCGESYLGEEVNQAVITAPAYFNNNQRNATKKAGELAGFKVLRIISEPTAAALAYGLHLQEEDLKVAVLDIGAGTFDITVLRMSRGLFNVISTSGDTFLGGKDMDDILLNHFVQKIRSEYSIDVSHSLSNMAILRDAIEEAKIRLSHQPRVSIKPRLIIDDELLRPKLVLTRKQLEDLIRSLVRRLDDPIAQAMDDAALTPADIDRVVLVGGPTCMPVIRKHIQGFFGKEPEKGIDPLGVVATGACLHGSMLNGEIKDLLLLDVTPLSLGIETSGGMFTRIIKRNTTIPVEERQVFATAEDNQTRMFIHVLQGERETVRGNMSLGLFKIDGIPPAPRYEEDVEVTFRIDADGILEVSAEVMDTGETNKIAIEGVTDLKERDLARIIIDATKHQTLDASHREAARVKENANAIIYGARKTLQRISDKLSEAEEKEFTHLLDSLETSLLKNEINAKGHTDKLKTLTETLQQKAKKQEYLKLLTRHQNTNKDKPYEETAKVDKASSYQEICNEVRKLREALILLEAFKEKE
ncbi:MAG: Hsp70 family protein [Pseudomonadota bacterium]